MDDMMRALRLGATLLLILGVMLVVGVVLAIRGPVIEAKVVPVWSQMTIEWDPLSATGGTLSASFYGYKERPCKLIDIAALVRVKDVWKLSAFTVDGRPPATTTRPQGWQSLGTWKFDRHGDRLRIAGIYRCHDMWYTPATLGEWDAPVPVPPVTTP